VQNARVRALGSFVREIPQAGRTVQAISLSQWNGEARMRALQALGDDNEMLVPHYERD
jgi:hypothetical protein